MAKVAEINQAEWDKWVAERPACVQELCRKYPPDRLYKMKTTGQRVTLVSYAEDGTVRVNVSAEHNAVMFERQVFGVAADTLEECDLPGPDETVGAVLTEDADIEAFGEAWRNAQRTTDDS